MLETSGLGERDRMCEVTKAGAKFFWRDQRMGQTSKMWAWKAQQQGNVSYGETLEEINEGMACFDLTYNRFFDFYIKYGF